MNLSDETLMAIAQIAVTLIGFSGVVTALGHEKNKVWSAAELLQLRTQVEPSLTALFGALLPATVGLLVGNHEVLWRICNALLAVFIVLALGAFLFRTRAAPTLFGQWVLTALSFVVLMGLILSATNVVILHQLTFMLGLWLGLLVGVYNFSLLLFRVERVE
jgi:hypothetical protein